MPKSATFTVDSINATLTFTWTTDKTTAQRVANNAAHYLFDLGMGNHGTEENPRIFDDLSNQEKIDMMLEFTTKNQRSCADSWERPDAAQNAIDGIEPYNWFEY